MSFIEEFARLRICLIRYVFCRNLEKLVIFVQFFTTVVNIGLHEPYLLLADRLFILILSESHRECLINLG